MSRDPGPLRLPGLARWLITLRVPPSERSYVLADLEDRFEEIARSTSARRARMWCWRQAVLSLVRPSAWPTGKGRPPLLLVLDLRIAARGLRKRPLQATLAVLTIAAGIGLTATAFSVLWGTVLRGLPFEDSERLVHFERAHPEEGRLSMAVTPHDYVDWREEQRSFEDLGAYVEAVALLANEDGPPDRYDGVFMSASAFPLLRVQAALGRTFTPEDEREGGPAAVVLGHGLWTSRFGGDPGLVGREIRLNGVPTTVIGIMPEGFGFPIDEQVWLPLRLDLSIPRGAGRLDVFGRLAPGATVDEARGEFTRISRALQEAHPLSNAGIQAVLRSFTEEYVGPDFVRTVYRMLVGALLVLLLGCINVAHLLLAHMHRRRDELAVRTALGASRGRLVTQLLVEAGVLGVAGALGGILVAHAGVSWFNLAGAQAGVFALPHGPSSLFWWNVELGAVTLLWIAALAVLVTLASGLVPAFRGARGATASVGRLGRSHSGRRPDRFSSRLVVAEVALSTGLLVAAGFVVQSVVGVAGADEGFDGEGVVVTRVDLPSRALGGEEGEYASMAGQIAFAERLLDRIEADRSVEMATIATELPLDPPAFVSFEVEGETRDPLAEGPVAGVVTVTPGYFRVFGLDAVDGRTLDRGDRDGALPVAVVNETFARTYLGGRRAVGARVRLGSAEAGDPWLTVVGIVPDLWDRPRDPLENAGVYVPVAQADTPDPSVRTGIWGLRYQSLAVRGQGAPEGLPNVVRAAVYREDPGLSSLTFRSMDDVVQARFGRYGVWGRFYLVFAAVALLLAGFGMYGVLAFGVERRTSEIGVRRALGATARDVAVKIMGTAFRQITAGAVLGLFLGYWLSRGLTQVLYDLDTSDARIWLGVLLVLGLVGAAASWIPARRAARVDPAAAVKVAG